MAPALPSQDNRKPSVDRQASLECGRANLDCGGRSRVGCRLSLFEPAARHGNRHCTMPADKEGLGNPQMASIQKADPKAKRNAIWILCIAAAAGGVSILAVEFYMDDLQSWLGSNIDFLADNTILVFLAALLMVAPILVAGAYFLLLGTRAVQARRFPPPGYAIARDMPVIEGTKGRQRGRIIQLLSLLLLSVAMAIPVFLWHLFRVLLSAMD